MLCARNEGRAQDPVFSQFYNSPVYLNPALVGEEDFMMFNFAHRAQWRSLHFPYTTSQASLIVPYYGDKHRKEDTHLGGVGVSFYADQAGEGRNLQSYGGNASFAYNVKLSNDFVSRISFAIQMGFIHKRIDKGDLQWGEQYNPFIGFDNTVTPVDLSKIENTTVLDIGAGAFYRYHARDDFRKIRSAYAGIAAGHLNHPDESVLQGNTNRLPVLYKFHGGVVYALGEKTSLSANAITLLQDQVNQTNIGSFLSYNMPIATSGQLSNFIARIGAWYRLQDSFIASFEVLTNNIHVGFSYDWNVTSLRYDNRGTGSYEITTSYRFYQPAAPKVRY